MKSKDERIDVVQLEGRGFGHAVEGIHVSSAAAVRCDEGGLC
jgi:hypothetical protein